MGSLPAPLQRIPDDAVDLAFPAPQYSADFASIVGNAATDSDGFDSDFNDASAVLIDFPNFLAGLDIALGLLDAAMPDVDTPWEQDFSDSLSGSISQGDPDFAAFDVHMTGNSPPPAGSAPGNPTGGAGQQPSGKVYYQGYLRIDWHGSFGYSSPDYAWFTIEVDPDAQGRTGPALGGGPNGLGSQPHNLGSGNSVLYDLPATSYGQAPVTAVCKYYLTSFGSYHIDNVTLGPSGQQVWAVDTSKMIGATLHQAEYVEFTVTFTPPKAAT